MLKEKLDLLIQGAVFTFGEIDKSILKARSYSHQNGNFGFFHLFKGPSLLAGLKIMLSM